MQLSGAHRCNKGCEQGVNFGRVLRVHVGCSGGARGPPYFTKIDREVKAPHTKLAERCGATLHG
eukprot:311116-Pelagomonas_calceolata.AAC.1